MFPWCVFAQSYEGIRVIDESAISYMKFLSKVEFDQRFPGQIKSERADLENGWYVIYIHENLNYHFGPMLLESIGQDYLSQLKKMVDAAVEQRPDIKGYQLVLSYEPATESEGIATGAGESVDDAVVGRSVEETPQLNKSESSSGFWGFFRKLFGM